IPVGFAAIVVAVVLAGAVRRLILVAAPFVVPLQGAFAEFRPLARGDECTAGDPVFHLLDAFHQAVDLLYKLVAVALVLTRRTWGQVLGAVLLLVLLAFLLFARLALKFLVFLFLPCLVLDFLAMFVLNVLAIFFLVLEFLGFLLLSIFDILFF